MPQKIPFTVVYASGEDERHRASELNVHGPTVRGWQSAPHCSYPQEVVLQLQVAAAVQRIQVLAHQYLIPEKLELWVGNATASTECSPTASSAQFEYLGFITLSDNQSTDFKSRELKSVTVPACKAKYLKLKLHKNHVNTLNTRSQVGLIAINILGHPDTPINTSTAAVDESNNNGHCSGRNNGNINALLLVNNPQYTSPYDDLAFEMYVDPEVAQIIRSLEEKKQQAVIGERFEYARRLKLAMGELRRAGERLGRLELDKRLAITREDFDRAKMKKQHMEQYRNSVYNCLDVDGLQERNGPEAKNDESVDAVESRLPEPPSMLQVPTTSARDATSPTPNVHHAPVSPLHHTATPRSPRYSGSRMSPPCISPTSQLIGGNARGSSLRRRNKTVPVVGGAKTSYEAYEERTIPALRHGHLTGIGSRDVTDANDSVGTPRSKLTDREKKQAALPLTVFGNDLVEKFFSKQYSDKEEGLRLLKDELRCQISRDRVPHGPNKTARATIYLLHRTLRDKVYAVYSAAAEAIRMFFIEFVPRRVTPAEVSRSVDRLLPELLVKSGDTTPRIHNMAVHTILSMADCAEVRDLHVIPVSLSRPLTSTTHPRLALSRLEMVEQLIINHGISAYKHSGLTCRTLSEFGSSGLHHPAEAVRKVAERVLTLVYKVNPSLVRKQLPPDDDITRRNLLYRQLFQEFDMIDVQRKKDILEKNRLVESASVTNSICSVTNSVSSAANSSSSGVNVHHKSPGGRGSSSSSASAITSPSDSSQPEHSDKVCIFCLSHLDVFTEDNLNTHYWRSCPMLMRCQHCKQVVEIASITQHLTDECEQQNLYQQCERCTEAIPVEIFKQHTNCLPAERSDVANRCPLCHTNIAPFEEGWRHHLIEQPCPNHPRHRTRSDTKSPSAHHEPSTPSSKTKSID